MFYATYSEWTSRPAALVAANVQFQEEDSVVAHVYVEARPKGRPEGVFIDDYIVEDHADHVLCTTRTQKEAIQWAKHHGHQPLVARVRHLNNKNKPDHWRSA